MLGIDVNVKLTAKDVHYPIYFDGVNECVACGAKGFMTMIDMSGNRDSHMIHPLDHMLCKKCGAKYSIKWVDNEDGPGKHPCAIDPSIARQFSNFVIGKLTKFDKHMNQTIGNNS